MLPIGLIVANGYAYSMLKYDNLLQLHHLLDMPFGPHRRCSKQRAA